MELLTTGSQVDQFRVVRKLGHGGMSEVYLARDTTLGRKVALKIIRAESAGSSKRLELFLHEARLTAKFAHPHIITIHTVGEFEGYPYLALEYLEGQTLDERMREGAMSAPETIRIGLAIAQALAEAHSHEVLHRDLKPANVIIPQDGRIRVLDFGISKIIENSDYMPAPAQELAVDVKDLIYDVKEPAIDATIEETAFDQIKGTPNYMAPERWLGEKVTGAADVWALGVILYQMLTQVHPFYSQDRRIEAIAQRIVSAQEPPLLPSDIDIPPELSELIVSMLDPKASRRPTGRMIVEVLQTLLQRKRGQPFEKRSPFRGLLPFSERHANLFYGRSTEIEMAVERLRNEPILPVVGPSGAGKSSFVAAGIVPRLRELDRWLVLTVRPGTHPFGGLASIIQAGWKGDVGKTNSPSSTVIPKFSAVDVDLLLTETIVVNKNKDSIAANGKEPSHEINHSSDSSLLKFSLELFEKPARLFLELQALADETRCKVLLFVDQLEELYTLEHEPRLRRAYMEAITGAADDPDGPIRVVFTVRDDYLGRVADTSSAQEALSRITVLRGLEEEALLEIVNKPVEFAGYSYEDEYLPQEMIDAVRDTPASLPILQFACSRLWIRRDREKRLLTRAAYEAMGGVEGALASEADDLLAGLSEAQRKVLKQLVLRLVTPEGTRRVISAQELLDGLHSNAPFVLNRLTSARMVVSRRSESPDMAETELELVHDSLIRNWTPLARWLEQSREEVVFLDEVSRAAELWVSRGRPKEEVWSDRALDEALAKMERCEAVPHRVTEFLEAGELRRQARVRGRRKVIFTIIGTLLGVISVLVLMVHVTVNQRELAVIQRDRERQARAIAFRESARAAYTKGDFLEARSKLRSSLEVQDSSQARALWWLLENESLIWSKSASRALSGVSVSPDGRLIAVSTGNGAILIYDSKTLERHALRGHKGHVSHVDFSPDGRWLASGADDREIRLWDLREETYTVLKGHTDSVVTVAFSPDGKRLISGGADKTVQVWDILSKAPLQTLDSGTPLRTFKCDDSVFNAHFTADGRFIISVNQHDTVQVWDAQSYKLVQVIEEPGMHIHDAATSPDGKLLAYGGSKGVLVIWDLEKREEFKRIRHSAEGSISALNFSPSGKLIAASTNHGHVLIWDTKAWSLRNHFQHSSDGLYGIDFLPSEEQLISASADGTLNLWKINNNFFQKRDMGHRVAVYSLSFTPDGKTLVTGAYDGTLRFWNVASGQSKAPIHGHTRCIHSVDITKNGKLLVSGSRDGSIRLWNIADGKSLNTLIGHSNVITTVMFFDEGTKLASSSYDKTIKFWDLESMSLQKSFSTDHFVYYIDIDPEIRVLAAAGPEFVELRDIESGRILRTLSGKTTTIHCVAFSDDGNSLYLSTRDFVVRRYQLDKTSSDSEIVARHNGRIYWFDIMRSTEEILGTPSSDSTAKIWKLATGDVITLRGHQDEVNSLRFSPDGTKAATVSDDSTVRLWDTATGRPLWHAPLMIVDPPWVLTQQGLTSFDDDAEPLPVTKHWQKALQDRGKIASATHDQVTLCLNTFDDELEIWDIPNDERSSKTQHLGIQQLLATQNGCFVRSDGTLSLTKASGATVSLGKQVDTMSRLEDSVFVLQAGKIRVFDLDGNQQEEFSATAGASALTLVGNTLALGFPDGSIELWRRNGSNSQKDLICREVEASPVTRIIPGPAGTIIAGFANGSIGIWSLETGERLYRQYLHGPVIHLIHQDQTVWAASELGSRLQLDLSAFFIEYCEFMERVWSSVPWIWEEGRFRYRRRPVDHICTRVRD